jgi:hypothetical protein
MEDEVDEEEAWAGRLDRWIPWKTEEWGPEGTRLNTFSLLFFLWGAVLFRGTHTPSFAHSAPLRVEDLL